MKRVIIFGAAKVGLEVKKQLESEGHQIIAYSDNDSNKWGSTFEGVQVIDPSKISSYNFDLIAIGNFKAASAIKKQLLEYGIAESKMIVPIQPVRIFPNVHYKKVEKMVKHITIIYGKPSWSSEICKEESDITFEINFQNNYWAFLYFVKQYLDYGENVWKSYEEKEQEVVCNIEELTLTLIVASDKKKIEEVQKKPLLDGMYAISVESVWLDKVVRNKTDFLFWKYRFPRDFNEKLIARLLEVREEMSKNLVSEDEFCVVGSTVLQLYGIMETKDRDDVDIILTKELRELYGKTLVIVSEHVEIHPQDQYDIMDDDIVKNPQYHFWCFGMKFMKLDDFYRNRKRKGVSDAKLIEYFYQNQVREEIEYE